MNCLVHKPGENTREELERIGLPIAGHGTELLLPRPELLVVSRQVCWLMAADAVGPCWEGVGKESCTRRLRSWIYKRNVFVSYSTYIVQHITLNVVRTSSVINSQHSEETYLVRPPSFNSLPGLSPDPGERSTSGSAGSMADCGDDSEDKGRSADVVRAVLRGREALDPVDEVFNSSCWEARERSSEFV